MTSSSRLFHWIHQERNDLRICQERRVRIFKKKRRRKAVEQVAELQGKEPSDGLGHEETVKWLKRLKSNTEKQVMVLDGIISKANNLIDSQENEFDANTEIHASVKQSEERCKRINKLPQEKLPVKAVVDSSKLQRARSYGRGYWNWENGMRRMTFCSKESKNYKSGKGSKGSQRVVVATVTNDGIRAVYMMCKEVRRRRITFGVQTLAGNVENIQHAVDPIFEHISYMVNYESEKLIAGKWGKPIVLLWMERIADLFNRNSIKHQSGRIVMETEAGVFTDKWKVIQDRGCRKRK
ncbi:Inositol-3-phosphate synthase 1-B [Dirofilaria immitis]